MALGSSRKRQASHDSWRKAQRDRKSRSANSKKVQRMARALSKVNVSCAGEGEPLVRRNHPVPPVELPIRSPWWQQMRRCGCPRRQRTRRCPYAGRLRTGTPGTKPAILVAAGRILEALISVLRRPSVENLSLGCGHHGSKRRESRHCHHELTHCLPPFQLSKKTYLVRSTFDRCRTDSIEGLQRLGANPTCSMVKGSRREYSP
jgi:hypothetical protein